MKAILINPLIDYAKLGKINKKYPPLDLFYISTFLKELNVEVSLIDASLQGISTDSNFWATVEADIFIISRAQIDRWQCPPLGLSHLDFIDTLKKNNPDSHIILYGPPEYVRFPEAQVISEVCSLLGKETQTLAFKDYPVPDYDLLSGGYFFPLYRGRFATIEATRGCHGQCTFCNKGMFPTYEQKTLEQMIQEIVELKKRDFDLLFFLDNDFLADKNFARKMMKILKEHNFKYIIQACSQNLTFEILQELADTGCKLIQIGVETFDETVLAWCGKKHEFVDLNQIVNECHKLGMESLFYMMTGLPGQTSEVLRKDYQLVQQLAPNYVSFSPFIDYNTSQVKGISNARRSMVNHYSRPRNAWMVLRNQALCFLK